MIVDVCIKPYSVTENTVYSLGTQDLQLVNFPCLCLDRDSYFSGSKIITGANIYAPERHNFLVGKACSVAEDTTFIIGINHGYRSVIQGNPSFLRDMDTKDKVPLKGTIILQNDVWIGYGATVMGGVVLHNGCVVAANAVVTKDVPPYAVVGGNPARVLFYRFDECVIAGLQKIAWWDWPLGILEERKEDFLLPVQAFVEKYLPEAERVQEVDFSCKGYPEKDMVLLIPDMDCDYPLYPQILHQYFEQSRPNTELLIYLSEQHSTNENIHMLEVILERYEACDSYVTLQTGITLDERVLFQGADYYITTRGGHTVHRTCLAEFYKVRILYGTDMPIFPRGLC